jgi:hypothetical protein
MAASWMTKYGPRKVRHEPPTLDEALSAAEGLTDDSAEQLQLAANLMDLPLEQVRAEVERLIAGRRRTQLAARSPARQVRQVTGPNQTTVVVERKISRRIPSDASKAPRSTSRVG